jgi:hypothetical protein
VRRCPFCHQVVAQDATNCPHAGCGKALGAWSSSGRPPPPPPPPPRRPGTGPPPEPRAPSCVREERSSPVSRGAAGPESAQGRPPRDQPPAPARASRERRMSTRFALSAMLVILLLGAMWLVVRQSGDWPWASDRETVDTGSSGNAAGSGRTAHTTEAPPQTAESSAGGLVDAARDGSAGLDIAAQTDAQLGLYGWRTRPGREAWLAARGGTREAERAVSSGLDWLHRHQATVGCWCNACLASGDANPRARCAAAGACSGPGKAVEMAHTGLALLAFQAAGHYTFNQQQYSQTVGQGLRWLVEHQRPNGALVGSLSREEALFPDYMYEHGIAAFALAEACAVAVAAQRPPDPQLLAAAKAAIRFIEEQQHDDGGWRYTSDKSAPSDTSVSSWQVLALRSAREAGIEVDAKRLAKVIAFFKMCESGQNGRTNYLAGRSVGTEATTGAGMLVHEFLASAPDAALLAAAGSYLAQYAEDSWGPDATRAPYHDYYLWHHCTLAMFRAGDASWKRWNGLVRDTVVRLQETGGCARGSWNPEGSMYGRGVNGGGRIYTTALAVLTLEVYYRLGEG